MILSVVAVIPIDDTSRNFVERPLMSEEAQNAKLRLVETVARYYWATRSEFSQPEAPKAPNFS
jgi:hypothetical protein